MCLDEFRLRNFKLTYPNGKDFAVSPVSNLLLQCSNFCDGNQESPWETLTESVRFLAENQNCEAASARWNYMPKCERANFRLGTSRQTVICCFDILLIFIWAFDHVIYWTWRNHPVVFAGDFLFTDNNRINRRNLKLLKQMKVMSEFFIRQRLNWGPECLKWCSTIVFVWFADVTCGTH